MVLNFNHKSKEKDKFINIILSEKEHILIKNYAEMNQQSIRKFSKKVILDYCHSQEAKKNKGSGVKEIDFDEHKIESALENDEEF